MARFAFIALVATFAVLGSYSAEKTHDLIVGSRVYNDFLIEQKQVDKGSFPLRVIDKTITLKGNGKSTITSVEVIDLKSNGHGATPSIIRGGPGETFVTVNFKSQRGHGIHFLVKVYAKD